MSCGLHSVGLAGMAVAETCDGRWAGGLLTARLLERREENVLHHLQAEDGIDETLRLCVEVLQRHRELLALARELVQRLKLVHLFHHLDLLFLVAANRILRLRLLQELSELLLESIVRLKGHDAGCETARKERGSQQRG